MALSKEQFSSLYNKGLSVEQIKSFEAGNKPTMLKGNFTVPQSTQDQANKVAKYQEEARVAEVASKKANSPLGFLGNFGKALVNNIAGSEVGLGKTIAKIANTDSKNTQDLQKSYSQAQDIQVSLLKKIQEMEGLQQDTTRLKQTYNNHIAQMKQTGEVLANTQTLPTQNKVIGQIGGTALDLLTAGTYGKAKTAGMSTLGLSKSTPAIKTVATAVGAPEIGNIATQKASGLFTRQGLGNVAKGVIPGYGSDVAQGLQGNRGEDRTGTNAFIPGVGTALGATLPIISETTKSVQNKFTQTGRINTSSTKRTNVLNTLERDNGKVRSAFENASRKGVDVKNTLATTNLLNGAVDSNGTISTKLALQNFDDEIAPFEGQVRKVIAEEGAIVSARNFDDRLQRAIKESSLEGGALTEVENRLEKEFGGLLKRADTNGNIPLTAVHDAKIFIASHQNYTDTGANAVNKEVARILKEVVQENTKTLDVESYNKGLSKMYAIRDVLEALNGKKVEGGRLGKHFSSVVGGVVGSSFGPLGTILGAETGRGIKSAQMKGAMGSDISGGLSVPTELSSALAGKINLTPQQKIPVLNLEKTVPKGTLVVPQSKKLGSLKTNQATTIVTTKNTIPVKIPLNTPKSTVKVGTVNDFFEPAPKKSLKEILGDTKGSIANPLGKGETSLQQVVRLNESSAKINRLNPKALDTIENFIDFQAGKFDNVDDVTVLRENIDLIAKELGITETGPNLADKLREILDARMGSEAIRKAKMLKVLPRK